MLLLCPNGAAMDLEREPHCGRPPQQWLGYPVILVCMTCGLVQNGLSEQAGEQEWTDQSCFFTRHNLNASNVWWCHTICRQCSANKI